MTQRSLCFPDVTGDLVQAADRLSDGVMTPAEAGGDSGRAHLGLLQKDGFKFPPDFHTFVSLDLMSVESTSEPPSRLGPRRHYWPQARIRSLTELQIQVLLGTEERKLSTSPSWCVTLSHRSTEDAAGSSRHKFWLQLRGPDNLTLNSANPHLWVASSHPDLSPVM